MRIIKQDLKTNAYLNIWWYIDWYKNNNIHREDGPANVWSDSDEHYYLNNQCYFKNKDNYWKEIHANY